MLESLRQVPATMCAPISSSFLLLSLMANVAVIAFSALLCAGGRELLVVRLRLSLLQVTGGTTALVLGITAALYVYYVYIVDSGASSPSSGMATVIALLRFVSLSNH